MSEKERGETDEQGATFDGDRSFDEAQQPIFGNQRVRPDSTRPPVGTQSDPVLPGVPTPAGEELYENPAAAPAKPTNETERGDKL